MVTIPLSGQYRGPGGPDPRKTRVQREQELRPMMGSDDGRDIILALTHEAMGVSMGTMLPVGMMFSAMIEEILNHEYPNG